METVISLEKSYKVPIWPIIVILALIIAIVIVYIQYRKQALLTPAKDQPFVSPDGKRREALTKKYSKLIRENEKDHIDGNLSERECFQKMSIYLRQFVTEMTGRDVTSYTYEDIKTLKNDRLTALIAAYYGPEFATDDNDRDKKMDLNKAVDKTLKLIKEWK